MCRSHCLAPSFTDPPARSAGRWCRRAAFTPTQLKTWRLELEAAGSVEAIATQKAKHRYVRDIVTGDEFVRRVRLDRKRGVVVCLESRKDKGSHGRLQYGDRFNAVEGLRKKISYGLLAASLPLRREERHPVGRSYGSPGADNSLTSGTSDCARRIHRSGSIHSQR